MHWPSLLVLAGVLGVCMARERYLLYSVNPGEGFNLGRDVFIRVAALMQKLNQERSVAAWPPYASYVPDSLSTQRGPLDAGTAALVQSALAPGAGHAMGQVLRPDIV